MYTLCVSGASEHARFCVEVFCFVVVVSFHMRYIYTFLNFRSKCERKTSKQLILEALYLDLEDSKSDGEFFL